MLSSFINTANYERDGLEQYGRKENGRLIEVPEEPIQYGKDNNIIDNEDCTDVVVKAAELIGVTLDRKGKGDTTRDVYFYIIRGNNSLGFLDVFAQIRALKAPKVSFFFFSACFS